MVHGFDFVGTEASDPHAWDSLKATLRAAGWQTPLQTWGYYGCDVGFDINGSDHGQHGVQSTPAGHTANECSQTAHTRDTSIEHLAYHWAWTVYDLYSKNGQCVDAVAHSMGGLIVRYALAQVQAKNPDYPSKFCVEDVVTLGTPHQGSELAGLFAAFCPSIQCTEMLPGSAFLKALPENPQAYGGTDWTLVGSDKDAVVSVASALGMTSSHAVVYFASDGISHALNPNYLADFGGNPTASVRYRDADGVWKVSMQSPWPLAWIDKSLVYDGTSWVSGFVPTPPTTTAVYPTALQDRAAVESSIEFRASCSDSKGDLLGAIWSTFEGEGWTTLHDDRVQMHDDPWLTSQTVSFPTAATYKIRVQCVNNLAASSSVEWNISAEPAADDAPTASRVDPAAASVQVYAGDSATFEASCSNDAGDLNRAEWWTQTSAGWTQTGTDTVQIDSNPWSTSQTYTMTSVGSVQIQVRCIDDARHQGEATWTVQVVARPASSSSSTASSGNGATRVSPASASVTVNHGGSVDFDVACEDAAHDLQGVHWYTKSPGQDWAPSDSDTVQFHANPWHSYETYTFPSVGSYAVRATCVKDNGAASSVDWTINAQ